MLRFYTAFLYPQYAMHVIRHDDELIGLHVWKMQRNLVPHSPDGRAHRLRVQQTQPPSGTHGYEVRTL